MSDAPDARDAGTADAPDPHLTPDGRVASEEAICLRCGYSIHGLTNDGACPECGMPVGESLRGRLLRFSDRGYVRTLHRGVTVLLVGMILSVLLQTLGGVAGIGIAVLGVRGAGGTGPQPAAVAPADSTNGTIDEATVRSPAAVDAADAEADPDAARDIELSRDRDAAAGPGPAPGPAAAAPAPPPPAPPAPPPAIETFVRLMTVLGVAIELVMVLGWWWFTSPDPALPQSERGDGPRRVIRSVVVLVAISAIPNLWLGTGAARGLVAGMFFGGIPLSPGVLGLLGLVGLAELAPIARFFAAMLYLRWMAPRLPDQLVEERSRLYIWLLPLIYVLGTCVVVGPLVAAVLQGLLLYRVRRDLDEAPMRVDGGPER